MKPLPGVFKNLLPLCAAIALCFAVCTSRIEAQTIPDSAKTKTSFWRIESDDNGVWWFVSPQGKREFLNTVTTVSTNQDSRQKGGAGYRSTDWNGKRDSQSLKLWAQKTAQRIKDAGFKGIGAWSDYALHDCGLPITRDLNLWSTVSGGPSIFAPEWESNIYAATKSQVEHLKDNPNIVGYYTDNELDWDPVSVGPRVHFDERKSDDPNRVEVLKIIRKLWSNLDELNKDWRSSFSSWEQLSALKKLPEIPQPAQERLDNTWLEHLSVRYFSVTTAAIRKYDPNHLILGVRFKGYCSPYVVRASRGYTDAQSINIYHEDAKLDREMFEMLHRESGQPIIISEYAFHALDGTSGNRNECGFPAQVANQAARAEGYKVFTSRMAQVPYIIGADWFQWNDEPPAGRGDGEDVNFGIVDIHDKPYELLVKAIRETSPQLNPLHSASSKPTEDVFRSASSSGADAGIPHVRNLTLDGTLTDWPGCARLQPTRQTETIGSGSADKPAAFAGWNEDGLWFAFDVHDNNINCRDLNGSWWTKDCLEFWLWLGGASDKRPAEFDRNSCQLVYLPTPLNTSSPQDPTKSGSSTPGQLVQWHRPGDALTKHLSPPPSIKQCTRMTNKGYTVEIFIPKAALRELKLVAGATFGFNFHIQDADSASKFYWSNDKGADTQTRPDTWGTVTLAD